jgi:DNA-binding beta-propeller fold protein YncE
VNVRGRRIVPFLLASSILVLGGGLAEAQEELFPPQFAFSFVYGRHPGSGIGLDPAGNVWMSDDGTGLFYVLDPYLVTPTTWAGAGTSIGPLLNPVDIAFAPNGDYYVLESTRVRKFDIARTPLLMFGSGGSGPGQFLSPTHLVCDTQANVYVADGPTGRVQKFGPTGTLLQTFDLPATPSSPSAGGVFVDAANRVFVTDTGNRKVVVFSASGQILQSWGVTGTGPGQLLAPGAIAVDAAGIVYVADLANLRVQKFLLDGTPLTYWRPTQTLAPSDLATGPLGRVYVVGHGIPNGNAFGWIQGLQYEAVVPTRSTSWGAVKRLYRSDSK